MERFQMSLEDYLDVYFLLQYYLISKSYYLEPRIREILLAKAKPRFRIP